MISVSSINQITKLSFKSSISNQEIESLKNAKQVFSDCYLISSLESLAQSENGRKILKEQIKHNNNNPNLLNCYLYTPNGEKEVYTSSINEATPGYESLYSRQTNNIIRSIDISINEYEKKHKNKHFFCKLGEFFKKYAFEYNLPSKFMKILTGIEPRKIAETDFNLDLTSYKTEVMALFKRMSEEKGYSFIISNGLKKFNGRRWHVYLIQDVNLKNNTITIKEKRRNISQVISIDKALKTFKFIVGYFNSDLKKI